MAYIVKSDYTSFTTTAISDSDFTLISERASDIIDVITFNKIADKGISSYPLSVQNKIKKATCALCESIQINGGVTTLAQSVDDLTSVSIGSFSYGKNSSSGTNSVYGVTIPPLLYMYLSGTGLLYCGGVDIVDNTTNPCNTFNT
jgi:hypothetical protein